VVSFVHLPPFRWGRVPFSYWTGGWVGPRACFDGVEKRKIPWLSQSSAQVKEWVELYLHSPNTPSWRGAQLKAQGQLYLYLTPLGTEPRSSRYNDWAIRAPIFNVKKNLNCFPLFTSPLTLAQIERCTTQHCWNEHLLTTFVLPNSLSTMRTSELGTTLAPLNAESWSLVW
jgi:hypothetical protein